MIFLLNERDCFLWITYLLNIVYQTKILKQKQEFCLKLSDVCLVLFGNSVNKHLFPNSAIYLRVRQHFYESHVFLHCLINFQSCNEWENCFCFLLTFVLFWIKQYLLVLHKLVRLILQLVTLHWLKISNFVGFVQAGVLVLVALESEVLVRCTWIDFAKHASELEHKFVNKYAFDV